VAERLAERRLMALLDVDAELARRLLVTARRSHSPAAYRVRLGAFLAATSPAGVALSRGLRKQAVVPFLWTAFSAPQERLAYARPSRSPTPPAR
jgi:hypothetical protein